MSRPDPARRVTRVLSLVRGADAGSARTADPALDLNAFAVADVIDLTLVLKDRAVELAVDAAHVHPIDIAGVPVPAALPSTDIRALLGSGVRVLAVADDLQRRGIDADRLVEGVEVVDESVLAGLLIAADVTLGAMS